MKQSILFLIGGLFSLAIAMGIGRFAYTPILPLMQEELDFSNAIAGYLATSNYAGYLVGAIFLSFIPFTGNRIRTFRISILISIATTILMGIMDSYFIWYILRFVSGVASAFVFVLSSSIVLDTLARNGKSSISGLYYGGVGFGIFLSSVIIPPLNQLFNWQGAWIGLGMLSLFFAIFVWIWLKEAQPPEKRKREEQTNTSTPSKKWRRLLITIYALEGLGYIVTGTFIVAIAEQSLDFHGDATTVWLVVGLAAIPSCIVWSMLAEKFGHIKALIISMTIQAIGIGIPVFISTSFYLIVSALLFGATFMGITTLATSLARQMYPINSSRIIGYMTAVYALGQMIGPAISGILSTYTNNFNAALLGAAGIVLLGALLLLGGVIGERKADLAGVSGKI